MEKLIPDSFDPITGTRTQTGVIEDKLIIHKDADLTTNHEFAKSLRNDDDYSKQGIKRGFFHAMHIPEVVNVELLSIGIDVMRASPKEIAAGLRRLGKEHFITTRKQI